MIRENLKGTEFSLQFLGINLKFDDLLILLILYFLYTEKVQDTSLFVVLFLLLLT